MTTYRYTSPYQAIFMDLTVGTKGLSVVHVNPEDDQPDGATVVLNEGDILTLPGDLEHAFLVETDKPAKPPRRRSGKTPAAVTVTDNDAPASDEKGN